VACLGITVSSSAKVTRKEASIDEPNESKSENSCRFSNHSNKHKTEAELK
jgi:hypothetical protein